MSTQVYHLHPSRYRYDSHPMYKLQPSTQREKTKAPTAMVTDTAALEVADLVYLHNGRNKSCARHRYLVVSVEGGWCNVMKFVGARAVVEQIKKHPSVFKQLPGTLKTVHARIDWMMKKIHRSNHWGHRNFCKILCRISSTSHS